MRIIYLNTVRNLRKICPYVFSSKENFIIRWSILEEFPTYKYWFEEYKKLKYKNYEINNTSKFNHFYIFNDEFCKVK